MPDQMNLFDFDPAGSKPVNQTAPKSPAMTTFNIPLSWYNGKDRLPIGHVLVTQKEDQFFFNGTGFFNDMPQPPTVLVLTLPQGSATFTKMNQRHDKLANVTVCDYVSTIGNLRLEVRS